MAKATGSDTRCDITFVPKTQRTRQGKLSCERNPFGHQITLLPDKPQGSQAVALGLDDHILLEMLEAFKAPEPRTCLMDQSSLFRIPQSL